MIAQGRECVKCGCDKWHYPECPPDRSRVKVTCAGCGRYIAHFDYDWKVNKARLGPTNAPEDQDLPSSRKKHKNMSSIDQLEMWGDE